MDGMDGVDGHDPAARVGLECLTYRLDGRSS